MAELQEILIANLTLDTYRKNNIPPLVVPKGDYGARVIRVMITEQGKAVTVKERDAVYIVAERSGDGASEAFSGKVNKDGSVTVPITQWMLDIPVYDVICHVVVTGNGYQYSTNSFLIEPQSKENPTELSEDDPRKNAVDELLAKENENYDAVKNTFSNAIKGNVSGKIVSMDDVSPVDHKVPVKLRSDTLPSNTQVNVKSCGKNLIPYPYESTTVTKGGLTFTDNGDGSVTINGTSTEAVTFVLCRGLNFFSSNTSVGYGRETIAKEGLCMSKRGSSLENLGLSYEIWGGGVHVLFLYCGSENTYNNTIVYPQIEVGYTMTEYELYKEGKTVTTTISDGAELASIAPNMTISTDKEGVIVEAQYNKDANKVIEKLTQAIISLGGNV